MTFPLQAPPGGIPLHDALRNALSWHAALAAVQVSLRDGRASLSASCAGVGCVLTANPTANPTANDTANDTAAGGATFSSHLSGGGAAAVRGAGPNPNPTTLTLTLQP